MADSFGKVRSTVEILDTASGSRTPVFAAECIFPAPDSRRLAFVSYVRT